MNITLEFIESSLKEKGFVFKILGNGKNKITEFCLNSKEVLPNNCFVAFDGKKHRGADYLQEAFNFGASGCIVDKLNEDVYLNTCKEFFENTWCVCVENIKMAFIELAASWRKLFTIPIIGITGSVGKTTTKEMIGLILKMAGHMPLVSKNSENSIIGLANTLLKLRSHHTIAVCEVGISQIGEMDILGKALNPDIAVITHVGRSHLNGLKNVETVFEEKKNIFKYLKPNGIIVVNGDIQELASIQFSNKIISFGRRKNNFIRLSRIIFASNFINATLYIGKIFSRIRFKSINYGFANSALAAIAAVYTLNIDFEIIKKAISDYLPIDGRFKIVKSKIGGCFIDDSYNANPESMREALLAFEKIDKTKKKAVIIGDMLDLGNFSDSEHKKIINFLKKFENLHELILIGSIFSKFYKKTPLWMNVKIFDNWEMAISQTEFLLRNDFLILVKASNSLTLGKIISKINSET